MFEEIGKDFAVELSTLLAEDFDRADYLAAIGNCYSGVLSGDKVGVVPNGVFGDAVVAQCNPAWGTPKALVNTTWVLGSFMIPKQYCYDTMASEIKRYEKLYELSTIDAAKKWISSQVESAFAASVVAKAFFGSTTTADYASAGFEGVNGIFTQCANYLGSGDADASQATVIGTNTKAWLKTGTNALEAIENMISDAPTDVKASENAVIVMNEGFYDALMFNLKVNKGVFIESQWSALFGGFKATTYNGYKLVVVPMMDKVLGAMATGDKFKDHPNMALFTTSDNLLFGASTNEQAGLGSVDIFDDKNTQTTKAIVKFSLGALVPNPKGFQLCY